MHARTVVTPTKVTRFNIYSDFRPFFKDFRNSDKIYRPSTTKIEEQHAIVLVG